MVETAFIGVADIHAGALAHGVETFEFIDLGSVVLLLGGDLGGGLLWRGGRLGHKAWGGSAIHTRKTSNFFTK